MPLVTALSQSTLANVVVAFDALIGEIETLLQDINKAGSNAFEANDYDEAYRAIESAKKVKTFYRDISFLKEECNKFNEMLLACEKQKELALTPFKLQTISGQQMSTPTDQLIIEKIGKGLRTPKTAFFRPILQALNDLGGSAKRSNVFCLIEQSMKDVLKPMDYQILPSQHGELRWQNSAQLARTLMMKDGLLCANSPKGIWKITEEGREFLKKNLR